MANFDFFDYKNHWMSFHGLNPFDLIPHWLDIGHTVLILLVWKIFDHFEDVAWARHWDQVGEFGLIDKIDEIIAKEGVQPPKKPFGNRR